MKTPEKSKFLAIPVIISSLVTVIMGSMIMTPTAEFMSLLYGTGVTIIPMGFILAYSIQWIRRQQVAYTLLRAVVLGLIVGSISVSLIILTIWLIIPGLFLLYELV